MFAKMVGLDLLRGLPGLREVINNFSSWLVWQMTFLHCFPVAQGVSRMGF